MVAVGLRLGEGRGTSSPSTPVRKITILDVAAPVELVLGTKKRGLI
jgi:hypothetical protein